MFRETFFCSHFTTKKTNGGEEEGMERSLHYFLAYKSRDIERESGRGRFQRERNSEGQRLRESEVGIFVLTSFYYTVQKTRSVLLLERERGRERCRRSWRWRKKERDLSLMKIYSRNSPTQFLVRFVFFFPLTHFISFWSLSMNITHYIHVCAQVLKHSYV